MTAVERIPVEALTPPAIASLGGLMLDTVEALGCGSFRRPCSPDCEREHEHDHETPHVAQLLEGWWNAVQSRGERLEDIDAGDIAPCATVRTSGRGGAFPLCIQTPHWRCFVNPWTGKARFVLAASYLAQVTPRDARIELERVARAFWGEAGAMKLSQLHVCSDFVGVDLASLARLDDVITHAKRVDAHYDDESEDWSSPSAVSVHATHRRITGVTVGSAASRLQVCSYDKVEQLRAKRLAWGEAYLRERGWDGRARVTRVECRFRARALDEFPGVDLRALASLDTFEWWGPKVWKYATTKGVRYVVPSCSRTRSRWKMRADWRAIAGVAEAAKRSRSAGIAQTEESVKRACAAFVTSAVRLAAEDEDLLTQAIATMRVAREHGEAASRGLILAVLVRYGEGLCTRALNETSEDEKALELRARLMKRRRFVVSRDAPPTEANATARGPTLAKVSTTATQARHVTPHEEMHDYSRLMRYPPEQLSIPT